MTLLSEASIARKRMIPTLCSLQRPDLIAPSAKNATAPMANLNAAFLCHCQNSCTCCLGCLSFAWGYCFVFLGIQEYNDTGELDLLVLRRGLQIKNNRSFCAHKNSKLPTVPRAPASLWEAWKRIPAPPAASQISLLTRW